MFDCTATDVGEVPCDVGESPAGAGQADDNAVLGLGAPCFIRRCIVKVVLPILALGLKCGEGAYDPGRADAPGLDQS